MAAVRGSFSIPSIVVSPWASPEQAEDKKWDVTDQSALNEILQFADELYVGVEFDNSPAGYVKVEIRREGMASEGIAIKKYTPFGELHRPVRAALELLGNHRVEMVWRHGRWDEREDWNLAPHEEEELS